MATALRALLVLLLAACSSTEHSSAVPQVSSSFQALIDNAQATLQLGTPTLQSSQKGDFEEGVLHFYLDDRYPLANTRLKIEELWLKAEVWLDGNSLGETLGGSFPSHLQ